MTRARWHIMTMTTGTTMTMIKRVEEEDVDDPDTMMSSDEDSGAKDDDTNDPDFPEPDSGRIGLFPLNFFQASPHNFPNFPV